MSDPSYQPPPVTRRGLTWRIMVAALLSLPGAVAAGFIVLGPTTLSVLNIVFGVLAWILVFFRRRWPTAVATITAAVVSVSALAAGPSVWALFSLATTRNWKRYLIAVAGLLIGAVLSFPLLFPEVIDVVVAMVQGRPDPDPDATRIMLLSTAVMLLVLAAECSLIAWWGGHIGNRREQLWSLERRAEEAEAERDRREVQARILERQRIAREMHDGLAHRISQISMHAGALAYRSDLSGDDLAESAGIIQDASHQALAELRDVLGVLRDTDAVAGQDGVTAPLPTAGQIPTLLQDSIAAGMQIEHDLDCTVIRRLPAGLGRAVHRIVQEGLTNAAKHAPGTPVRVAVRGQSGEHVEVMVSNPLPTDASRTTPSPESGFGLIGLTERVELLGGSITAGQGNTTGGGRWVLLARLPWNDDASANPGDDHR